MVLCLCLTSAKILSQEDAIENTRLFYRTDKSGSIVAHTHGLGVNFRYSKRMTGFKKHVWSAELVSMKHPKEDKSYNPYFEDTKGYVYGKLNSVALLRPAWGIQHTHFSKETKAGVAIATIWQIGPVIGFAKPVYLEIAYPSIPNYETRSTERYDPEKHTMDRIYGKASGMHGIDEIRLYPGIHGKFGLNFEYAPSDDGIKALETGITLDAFFKTIPIMAFTDNERYYVGLYVHFQWGKKYF